MIKTKHFLLIRLSLFLASFFIVNNAISQTTETYETESSNSTSFTDNGQVFNITSQSGGTFDIQTSYPGTGWNGTAADNRYIDNDTYASSGTTVSFTIASAGAVPFKVGSFWLYLADHIADVNVSGTLTVVGKLAGNTIFTATASSGFNTNLGVTNGYTLINLSSFGGSNNSSKVIDRIVITTGGSFEYVALDAFTWSTYPALQASTVQTNVSCSGGSNGTATVVASGGSAPYTYSWAPSGGTSATATGLSAGSYTCTITDASSVSIIRNFTITQPSALTAGTSKLNVACYGGNNGLASVTPSGGTPVYTYSWSPTGGSGSLAMNLSAGSYNCTITDANWCTLVKSFVITQPPAINAATSKTDVSCNGAANAYATVLPTGGTPAYTYSWAPSGGTASTATGLAAGAYSCTITDANACQIVKNFIITQPSALTASNFQYNIVCNGASTGMASVTTSGGTPSYAYSWAPFGGSSSIATGLSAGTYTCTITDANNCQLTRNFTLTQRSPITVNVYDTICTSALPYTWNGHTFTLPGTYTAHLTSWLSCDSAVIMNLAVNEPSFHVTNITLCHRDSLLWNGQYYRIPTTDTVHLTNHLGCDSVDVLHLQFHPFYYTVLTQFICKGSSYSFNNQNLTQAGTYYQHFTSYTGCDSTIRLRLLYYPAAVSRVNLALCNGSSLVYNGQTYTKGGVYLQHAQSYNGCDSLIQITITQKNKSYTQVVKYKCPGDSVLYNGRYYSVNGNYNLNLTNQAGCDSIVTLRILTSPVSYQVLTKYICQGDSLIYNNVKYKLAGTYFHHFANRLGCDSTVRLRLLYGDRLTIINVTLCLGQSYTHANVSYTLPGTYRVHYTNYRGCDSSVLIRISKGFCKSNESPIVTITNENEESSVETMPLNASYDVAPTVYPNPTSGAWNLVWETKDASPLKWQLFDSKGQVVKEGQETTWNGRKLFESNESNGVYWLLMEQNGVRKTERVIISKD
jgi:hypothetical protein